MKLTVATIVKGRAVHLANQAKGLAQSTVTPDEWVIVGMDEDPPPLAELPFPVRRARIDGDRDNLPLASARNHAAELAQFPGLVLIDVDCIPAPDMLGRFRDALIVEPRLWMGSPRYLPAGAAKGDWDFAQLDSVAEPHRLQPAIGEGQRFASDHYELFWSLAFAIRQKNFQRIGGFETGYRGYGGEDTDFAFKTRAAGVPFGFVDARAYHQHHPSYDPPLNHFRAIVENARLFNDRWDTWPMGSWLEAFAEAGLLDYDPSGNRLAMVRQPSQEEIESARRM